MPTTTFTTVAGILLYEERGGTETSYTPDPLGSLIECRNSTGTKSFSAEYWPYGEIQLSSGSNPSPWGFVGLLGYVVDTATLLYVRARYLLAKWSRWLTNDPLWPYTKPYTYASNTPVSRPDATGLIVAFDDVLLLAALLACLAAGLIISIRHLDDPYKKACEFCIDALVTGIFSVIGIILIGEGGAIISLGGGWGSGIGGAVGSLIASLSKLHKLCEEPWGIRDDSGCWSNDAGGKMILRNRNNVMS